VSIWTWAVTVTGLAIAPNPAVAVAMFTILGVGNGLWISLTTTIRQRLTPERMLGRGNAVFRTVSWGVVPFGAALGGVIARFAGLRAPFIVAAVATLLCAVFSRRLLRPVTDLGQTSAAR
jgi:predicted MFS family arabinose efflux permease